MKRLWLLLAPAALLIIAVAVMQRGATRSGVSAEVTALQHAADAGGYARATTPRAFAFPADHGPHPEYQTEWWYYTGNLDAADGKHFGFQLTFFRRAITPTMEARVSDWATSQIYFAHFALTDVAANRHTATERFSRGAAGLAGASGTPFRVWLENWSVESLNADGSSVRLLASDTPAGQGEVALDLTLSSAKLPALHGDAGLSRKSVLEGNASYYFSYTRLATEGALTADGRRINVSGQSWMDHEFGTTGLGPDATGWDWFSLQLNDGRELMLYQIRQKDGSIEPLSSGTLVARDGSMRHLANDQFRIEVGARWKSPRTGADYPARWKVSVPSEGLALDIEPLVADQEMDISFKYWEGAVRVEGQASGKAVTGTGYVELTGYGGQFLR